MRTRDLINMGLKNLWRRKARTFLTILGVIIGACSIILMVSIGLGQEKAMYSNMEAFGGVKTITISNNAYGGYGGYEDGDSKRRDSKKPKLNDESIAKIMKIKGVENVIEFLTMNLTLQTGRNISTVNVFGIDLKKASKLNIRLDSGTLPEADSGMSLAIGKSIANFFYDPRGFSRGRGGMNRIVVDFNKDSFKAYVGNITTDSGRRKRSSVANITGTVREFSEYGYSAIMDINTVKKLKADDLRRYPPSDANRRKKAKDDLRNMIYSQFKVIVKDIKDVESVQKELKKMNFNSSSPMEYINQQKQNLRTQQLVLGGIGAVSLFVAAIGIANTMIMAIYERTREIGVMKVLGADVRDILKMFLFEAAMIGLIGGIIGVGLSYGGSGIINHFYNQMQNAQMAEYGIEASGISYIPIWLMFASLLFSMLVGLVSGLLPAIKATELSALEAIKTNA